MASAIDEAKRSLGWCRAERLRLGVDRLVEETPTYTLVRCVDGLHAAQWIVWSGEGKCLAIGPERWVRKRLAEMQAAGAPEGQPRD